MASSDQLSSFRWAAVLVATTAGLYASVRLYNSYVQQPATTLHRSNAVHRRPPSHKLSWNEPNPEAPFGTILIRKDSNETLAIDLATMQLPSTDELRETLGNGSSAMQRDAQLLALRLVLNGAVMMVHDWEQRGVLESHGFHELAEALHTRSPDGILRASIEIPKVMHLDALDEQQVRDIIEPLITGDNWTGGHASGSEGDDLGPAETEEEWDTERAEPGQGLRGLLYYIAENDAKRKAYEHRGVNCEECGVMPIRGVRWHCLNCPDYDLCSSCETNVRHPQTHVFAKIKIPVPVLSQPTKEMKLWYPGDPRRLHPSLCVHQKKQLCEEYGYEEPQLEAMYDQFTCLANVPWEQDPRKVKAAIDRRAFNKAMTSDRWPAGLATNAIIDRMFAFYDTDNNGVIGLTEFLNGMAYLRGPKRFASLTRTIQGYDLDGDGYVNRADFLRMLRAKHIIQKQLISDQVELIESERLQVSAEMLSSNQPISSIFSEERIPDGETRQPRGKQLDAFGDLQPLPTTKTILDDEAPFVRPRSPREQVQDMLSRIEDHISSPTIAPTQGDGDAPGDPEVHRVSSVITPLSEDEVVDPYMQDILWHVEEHGFNELLDPLFKRREEEDAEIVSTRAERMKWASEVRAALAAEADLRSELMADTTRVDPFRHPSNPLDNLLRSREEQEDSTDGQESDRNDHLLPTDWASLERREAQIAGAPLEDLLDSIGAGLRDEEDTAERASYSRIAQSHSSTTWEEALIDRATSPLQTGTLCQDSADPTLPQHRADTVQSDIAASNKLSSSDEAVDKKPPTIARLNRLARLNDLEREMNERGGPGRLAYDEVEHIVVANGRSELRGMVRSWLEWASF